MPQFSKDTDTSKFRKDIDSQKAVELIMMCADEISNRYLQKYKNRPVDEVFNDAEKIMKDLNECMDILKFGIILKLKKNDKVDNRLVRR